MINFMTFRISQHNIDTDLSSKGMARLLPTITMTQSRVSLACSTNTKADALRHNPDIMLCENM